MKTTFLIGAGWLFLTALLIASAALLGLGELAARERFFLGWLSVPTALLGCILLGIRADL